MSTIATTNLKHPSSATNNLTLASTGAVAINGAMTGAGLDLITTQTFISSSSVSVNNCFTYVYDNYRIIFRHTSSAAIGINFRLRFSGTDATANYQTRYSQLYTSYATNTSTDKIGQITSYGIASLHNIEISGPNLSAHTAAVVQGAAPDTTYMVGEIISASHQANTQFDGFSLICTSGNISGNVSVYGYKK